MRWVMPQPCIGSRARVLRMSRSSVPCKRSDFGLVMMFLQKIWRNDTHPLVDSQGKKGGFGIRQCFKLRHSRKCSSAPEALRMSLRDEERKNIFLKSIFQPEHPNV